MGGGKNKRKRRAERSKDNTTADSSGGKKPKTNSMDTCLYFQDVLKQYLHPNNSCRDREPDATVDDKEENISLAFFELANSPRVGFRTNFQDGVSSNNSASHGSSSASSAIVVYQDTSACEKHTGGIVWETSYLLLQYLLAAKSELGITLEVGAGCGLLGQVLAAHNGLCEKVVMTETEEVMDNLKANVERNQRNQEKDNGEKDISLKKKKKKSARVTTLEVEQLDWEHVERDVQRAAHLEPHSCDTIVGTDVIFSPKLVEPLLKTLRYMSHSRTNIYLCLQERCAVSHQLLLEKAPVYGFDMSEITDELSSIPSCRWGQSLECRVFHIVLATASAQKE